jgi:hypothetical protein
MKESIKQLKVTFGAEDFILTGSYVLAQYGLKRIEDVNDIDIILVKPDISTLKFLNNMMKEFPCPSTAKLNPLVIPEEEMKDFSPPIKKKYPHEELEEEEEEKPVKKSAFKDGVKLQKDTSQKMAVFFYNKIKIDIYIQDSFSEPFLLIDGIKHTTIPHIIQAKKSYGRMKDWLQCRDMSRIFFNPEEFQKMLNSDWKSSLREGY